MTLVFRRFDFVAMTCAALVVAAEGVRFGARVPFGLSDWGRAGVGVAAGALAVCEGEIVSPRIAALHFSGALRGIGAAGAELARLHDVAELLGKAQVVLLAALLVLFVFRGGDS